MPGLLFGLILAFWALKCDISVVYGLIKLCFGYDTPVGLCYHISRAQGHTIGFRGPLEPLNDPITSKVDSILYLAISIILDVYTVSRLYFEFDVAVGLFYQNPKTQAPEIVMGAQDPQKGPFDPIVADIMN